MKVRVRDGEEKAEGLVWSRFFTPPPGRLLLLLFSFELWARARVEEATTAWCKAGMRRGEVEAGSAGLT
jgi:hypothetical protein